jgi:CRISPR-associated protein Cas2
MFYVVTYDIEDDKRRNKISEILENYGKRVNYSVFEIEIDEKNLKILISKILSVYEKNDNIRFYAMHKNTIKKSFVIGKDKTIF